MADYFGVSKIDANKILRQQISAVSECKTIAQHLGISSAEISRMSIAFKV